MLNGKTVGLTCGCWDLMHAGHCILLEDCKRHCDYLIVGLQTDPSIDRPDKNLPIQSLKERRYQLNSNKHVDEIFVYTYEKDLLNNMRRLLSVIDVRIIGSDYKDRQNEITGLHMPFEIIFHDRNHGYSTSELRHRIHLREIMRLASSVSLSTDPEIIKQRRTSDGTDS